MSRERTLHLEPAQPQQPQRDDQVAPRGRQFHVGDPVPHVLTKQELADFTGYSFRQIDRFRKAHSHPGIVQLEGPGHPRFQGAALKTWLANRPEATVPAARRFFVSHGCDRAARRGRQEFKSLEGLVR